MLHASFIFLSQLVFLNRTERETIEWLIFFVFSHIQWGCELPYQHIMSEADPFSRQTTVVLLLSDGVLSEMI